MLLEIYVFLNVVLYYLNTELSKLKSQKVSYSVFVLSGKVCV